MEYLDLGVVLATISVPIVMYYSLTIDTVFNDELIRWWNGESYDGLLITAEILIAILIYLLTFVLIFVGYPVIAVVAILAKVVVSLRNKRLEAIKNQN